MADSPTPTSLSLPSIAEVDATDARLGSVKSDLELYVAAFKSFRGETMPVDEFFFLTDSGIAPEGSGEQQLDAAMSISEKFAFC